MLTVLWLLSLSVPTLWTQNIITCPYKSSCQQARVSGNDVVLKCDHPKAQWYFTSLQKKEPILLSSVANIKKFIGGSVQLSNPQLIHTGLYRCQDNNSALLVEYEIEFQDVSMLHITHKGLNQKPLENKTMNLGGNILVYTHWGPWQDCNRCGQPGERKRLGYCYIEAPHDKPMPCGLYLRGEEKQYSRMRPELQVEACTVLCDHVKEINQPFFVFDIYQLGKLTNNMWLTCPLASIYR